MTQTQLRLQLFRLMSDLQQTILQAIHEVCAVLHLVPYV